MSRTSFFEKRRQIREPVQAGGALVDGVPCRVLNWSLNGLLLDGLDRPMQPGRRFSADLDFIARSGERFSFPIEARVVRWQTEGRVAATYVCLDAQVARRILTHFQPVPGPRLNGMEAEWRREAPRPPPADEPAPATTAMDDSVRLADTVLALKEITGIKSAFARRFHPDTAPRDASYELRVQLFKEFWEVLDAAEKRLKGR
ncbi:hypothetical protein [Rhodocista pekingensis]|uniref:PilZ domain-containing protein n=1 Tax=Rhodocista pekingensis TaxID=201185 RepID=A0ABW2KYR4_9PROT